MKAIGVNYCGYPKCKQSSGYSWLCKEHYLLKEALYGVYDCTVPDKEWNGGNIQEREHFKRWGIERMIEYIRYKAGREVA
jgi:hypothetical protein